MKFEWDLRKAQQNLLDHEISFEEATTVFSDPLDHSSGEARFLTLGLISSGRLIVVSHIQEGDTIRIISARQATTHERKQYEP